MMADNARLKNPVFIFGFPRSGTTLFRSVLGQHSKISLVNEPELIWALRHAGYDIDSKFSKADRSCLIDKLNKIGLCRKHLERNAATTIPAFLNSKDDLSFKEVFEKLLPKHGGDQMVWGEKSLNNLFFTKELSRIYPKALLIHIVRDPRSVILSYYQKARRRTSGEITNIQYDCHAAWLRTVLYFARQARLWKHWISVAKNSEQLISGDNWIEITFEDFLKNPQKCLRSVCSLIGIAYEDRMIESVARHSDPVLTGSAAYAHTKLAQDLDPTRADSYQELPGPLVWTIERLAGAMMQQIGYRQMRPDLPVKQRLALNMALAGTRWQLRREEKSHLKKRCLTV
jgi:hypothetical protein